MDAAIDRNMNKYHRKAMTVEAARELLQSRVRPVEPTEVELAEAIGRRLAAPIRTVEPIPHFRRSGMDGYAIRTADIAHASAALPIELEIIEHIPCGKEPLYSITEGKAARIMTGGMVPDGADAVIMQEMTEAVEHNGRSIVRIQKKIAPGLNITPIGEEAGEGTLVIEAGEKLGAGHTAILAALGYNRVPVYRKPKVAVLSTGTELLRLTDPLQMGKIRNSNAYMLMAQIIAAGAQPLLVGQIPDDYPKAERMLYDLLASDADLIVTSGGVSVGDYDSMADFFLRWEGTTLFNKIAMRPGSPTTAGAWKDKLLFGLSGNPSACFVGFELFVRPVIQQLQGAVVDTAKTVTCLLAADYEKVNAYTRYVRGQWYSSGGNHYAKPVGRDKSSTILSLKDANCLIVIPPTKTGIVSGEIVQIIPLDGALIV
ncbi:molybdopterin molybdotransferase [Paenibacillus cellulosilyticus]|uniref:Molybdopterin molybdenumtransferase n=1 Tax=Paenibacillus cellulosilyticus TaxID=375489 RepID=A0A2V2YPX3_9BACL|nr:gephyrin-like molybdotransferase Glp [Paenibacillus cellulosilyticus]PWV98444.1 molybdopterin molybdotransferase [Paenibacillus cellulosilyticus]